MKKDKAKEIESRYLHCGRILSHSHQRFLAIETCVTS